MGRRGSIIIYPWHGSSSINQLGEGSLADKTIPVGVSNNKGVVRLFFSWTSFLTNHMKSSLDLLKVLTAVRIHMYPERSPLLLPLPFKKCLILSWHCISGTFIQQGSKKVATLKIGIKESSSGSSILLN